jgi:peptide/nickel transport system substrate-binding protein
VRPINTVSGWRWLAIIGVFALVAAACQPGPEAEPGTTAAPTGTTAAPTGTTAAPGAEPSGEAFTYEIGIFADTTTDNFWAYYDPESSVWNAYVLGPTVPTLYTLAYPAINVVPDVAAEAEVPAATQDGDLWSVEVPLRPDATWSDGEAIDAEDVVFTFETVRDLALGGNWLTAYPLVDPEDPAKAGIESVEAVDATTVKITFNQEPGLFIWPHSIGVSPIMPQHFWADTVAEAAGADDPATEDVNEASEALYQASGTGSPSGGPVIFESREAGSFARNVANESWYASGEEVTSGDVTFTQGPFLSEEVFSLYGSQDAAVLALRDGEVDFLLNPLGMQRGLRSQVEGSADLSAIVNPTYGFRYLAFNLRQPPMNDPAFRDALAVIIDKQFMAQSVLQGVAFPLWTLMPEGNELYYDGALAEEIAAPYQEYENEFVRFEAALQILRDAGYTWATEPTLTGTADEGNQSVTPGEGIAMPDGTPVDELEILAPGPAYDPLRATYSIWIEKWLNDLGFAASANPTDFNAIVDAVFPSSGVPDFDMYILGWSLGNPAAPDFYPSFFHSRNILEVNGGNNNMGYSSPEFDALADQLLAAQTEAEAKDIIWQLETILDEDLPYIVLFDTGILEFYRNTAVDYPVTETLSGLQQLTQAGQGHSMVTAAR